MQALFSENVCENERIGSREGGHALGTPLDLHIPLVPKRLEID